MLDKIDTTKKIKQKEYKERMDTMQPKLSMLARTCKEQGIPVIILFEGFGASGKGTMIARLIEPLDPRGFKVYTTQRPSQEEQEHPFLWRFFCNTPAKGKCSIFDRSWYTKVLRERMEGITGEDELLYTFDEINQFEQLLAADGTVIIKFFLHISKKEQCKRFQELISDEATAWRVTYSDWEHYKQYDTYRTMCDEMIERTDHTYAPWNIIEAEDEAYATVKVYDTVIKQLEFACKERNENNREHITTSHEGSSNQVLQTVDLKESLDKDTYKQKMKQLQKRLAQLQSEMFLKGIASAVVFEGWDAAGKGGAIKRLTQRLDPRGYAVVPISAPDETERAHHYLWRFYKNLPANGHLCIFDRSWYGRVLVERIEGFCSEEEWLRAYTEINQFEEQLSHEGTVLIKFWLHIDREEQKKRFEAREHTPGKQWKITEEDWRNRSKWGEYEVAVNDMIVRTSTTYAPWTIVEGNCKRYARVKVLETMILAYETRLKEASQ